MAEVNKKTKKIVFVTTNAGKAREARGVLKPFGIQVVRRGFHLEEPQSDDVREIVLTKARQALRIVKAPLIVEDTGIYFDACKNFPGAYARPFVCGVGLDGVLRLLRGKGVKRTAFFQSIIAFTAPKTKPRLFVGRCFGVIAKKRKGRAHHARLPYDEIFVPRGFKKTFAEMTVAEKARVSHRARALRSFGKWFSRR
ncbi:MAG: non-canonical purine NTP pyrophosphatase [Candidatus Norongarragalinales archaeon]